jgi:uncharacterized membrane protein YphA (DoxX/SURF4 family)
VVNNVDDELILVTRLLLVTLFLVFCWRKLRDYSGTVSQIVQLGAPMPALAAAIAIFMELPVAFAVAVGAFLRASALLMFLYTLGTALIGHRYWCREMASTKSHFTTFQRPSTKSTAHTAVVQWNERRSEILILPYSLTRILCDYFIT